MFSMESLNRIRQRPAIYETAVAARDLYSLFKGIRRGSFSQHGEDMFAERFFGGRSQGFYLDIGASHPYRISNTYLLYRAGWRGVTVEPIPRLGKLHRRWRSRDTLFPVAVGRTAGRLPFFEMTPSVLSTLDQQTADEYLANGRAVIHMKYDIEVVPINEIIERASAIDHVDFVSIDIEGLDAAVLSDVDFSKFRPGLICVEFNEHPDIRDALEVIFERADYERVAEIGYNYLAAPRAAN